MNFQPKLGIQVDGQSPYSIKKMALQSFLDLNLNGDLDFADIGAGKGELIQFISPYSKSITLVDDYVFNTNNERIISVKSNLNKIWSLNSNSFDFVFSLEVIEHIENPRHFISEIKRIIKPGGYAFISTPNNLNIFSRVYFLFQGEHRFFQDSCYPAHISCLTKKDFYRICNEQDLNIIKVYYNYEDIFPFLGIRLNIKWNLFSNSVGFLIQKKSY